MKLRGISTLSVAFGVLASMLSAAHAADSEGPTITYDVGGSSGNTNGKGYMEAHVGVNYFILPWLKWRNAPFYRFRSDFPAAYGLDSSLLGTHTVALADQLSATLGVGGGYRLINTGNSAPFAEGQLGIGATGLRIQGSVKKVFHSAVRPGAKDDMIYTITFGGSGVVF